MGPTDMEGIRPSRSALVRPAAIVPLVKALALGPVDQFTGALHVSGHPGGVFYLDRGMIAAVDSPGAPDVSTLLLRSGRITEEEWADAAKAGVADGRIGTELVSRELVGPVELQVMCQMAALDGAFAISVGRIDDCRLIPDAARHWLPAQHGLERESLLRETERRLSACARGSISIAPYQDRLSPLPYALDRLDDLPDEEHRQILRRVNGRHTARDIAFMLGRSVYAVTVQVSRMLADGLIEITTHPAVTDLDEDTEPIVLRPRSAVTIERPVVPSETQSGLPRRRRGASRIHEVLAERRAALAPADRHINDVPTDQGTTEPRKDSNN